MTGKHNHFHQGVERLDFTQHRHPVFSGHLDIEEYDIHLFFPDFFHCLISGVCFGGGKIPGLQALGKYIDEIFFVIYQQYAYLHSFFSLTY